MVIGPGGAGVSVAAASGALGRNRIRRNGSPAATGPSGALDDAGGHTLLVTIDRWSPTAELLGVFRSSDEPVPVSGGLHLLSLDRLTLLESTWADFTAVLAETMTHAKLPLPGLGALAEIAPGELAALPGVEEFLLLRRIRDEATGGRWRRIVVDVSGPGDPFELLRASSVLSQGLNRLWPRHRRLAAAAEKPVFAQLTAAVDAIDRDCLDIAELIVDPHSVALHLVTGTDDRSLRLLPHLRATVDVMGLPLRSVLVNPGADAPAAPDRVTTVRALIGDGPVVTEMRRVDAPIDRAARLRKLAVTLPEPNGCTAGSGAAVVTEAGDGTPTGAAYELRWRQRLPDPSAFELGRSGDDLLVTVGGFRHPVRLPSVLRRCDVVDASWDGDLLTVRFVPDPAVWPQGRRAR